MKKRKRGLIREIKSKIKEKNPSKSKWLARLRKTSNHDQSHKLERDKLEKVNSGKRDVKGVKKPGLGQTRWERKEKGQNGKISSKCDESGLPGDETIRPPKPRK